MNMGLSDHPYYSFVKSSPFSDIEALLLFLERPFDTDPYAADCSGNCFPNG